MTDARGYYRQSSASSLSLWERVPEGRVREVLRSGISAYCDALTLALLEGEGK